MGDAAVSIARLRLDAGARTPESFLRTGAEYLAITGGRATVAVAEAEHTLERGDVLELPPCVPHHVRALTALEALVVCAPAFDSDAHVVSDR